MRQECKRYTCVVDCPVLATRPCMQAPSLGCLWVGRRARHQRASRTAAPQTSASETTCSSSNRWQGEWSRRRCHRSSSSRAWPGRVRHPRAGAPLAPHGSPRNHRMVEGVATAAGQAGSAWMLSLQRQGQPAALAGLQSRLERLAGACQQAWRGCQQGDLIPSSSSSTGFQQRCRMTGGELGAVCCWHAGALTRLACKCKSAAGPTWLRLVSLYL